MITVYVLCICYLVLNSFLFYREMLNLGQYNVIIRDILLAGLIVICSVILHKLNNQDVNTIVIGVSTGFLVYSSINNYDRIDLLKK